MVQRRSGGEPEPSAEAVVAWARDRAARGASLRVGELALDPDPRVRAMVIAARHHFGAWSTMLGAAGLELARRGRVAPPLPSADEVLAWVRTLAAAGTPLTSSWLSVGPDPTPRRLLAAGRRHFGSWERTVAAAGVERTRPRPSGDAVVAWLQALVARRGSVPRSPLELRDDEAVATMVAGARHHFGSWRGLLVAAGLVEPAEAPPAVAPGPRDAPPVPVPPPASPAPVDAAPAPPPPAPPVAEPPSTPEQRARRWLGAEVVLAPLPFAARWAAFEAEVAAARADDRRVPTGLVLLVAEALAADQAARVRSCLPSLVVLLERHGELLELSALDGRHHALAQLVRALEAAGLPTSERLAGFAQAWGAPASRRPRRPRS